MPPSEDSQGRPAAPQEAAPGGLEIGTILKGSYRITGFLGEGGAGEVYVAEHVSLGNRVAVKILFAKHVRDETMRRRFIEEAIIQANLGHANIARVFDVLNETGMAAIFMEFVEGSSMDRLLAALKEPPPVERVASWFIPILEAVAYAHSQGVVHRDIKPANVLMAGRGLDAIPKVTDFGIAKVVSDHRRTETGTAMGTIYYAAPEQLTDAKSVDHRADVYALGCTLYELLTLHLPFEDSTLYGVMQKHLQAPRPDPSLLNPNVSRELANVVMRAMAVNPDHRFQTCSDFAAEMRRVTGQSASLAAPSISGDMPERPQGPIDGTTSSISGANLKTLNPSTRLTGQVPNRTMRRTRPGTINTPPRPRPPEKNVVSIVIWSAISVLALGVLIALVGMMRRAPAQAPTPSAEVALAPGATGASNTAAETALAATASGEETTAPGGEATPPPAAEPIAEAPALPTPMDCTRIASAYIYFEPLGEASWEDAFAELSDHFEPCRLVMEAAATDAFERELAFIVPLQIGTTLQALRARSALQAGDTDCDAPLTTVTEVHRGLRHLTRAAASGNLMDYEIQSLSLYVNELTHLYVETRLGTPDCPFSPIPDEYLGEERVRLQTELPPGFEIVNDFVGAEAEL